MVRNNNRELQEFIKNGHKTFLTNLVIDCAIFGYHQNQLKILLGRWKGLNGLGLPGGFVKKNEPLSQAADRILKEKTGLDNIFLEQYHTFGDTPFRVGNKANAFALSKDNWLLQRTVSIGYYALVEFSKVELKPDHFIEDYEWHDIKNLPALLFDHDDMIITALQYLRLHLYHKPIGYNLLEKEFTLPEIQSLYETIIDKTLDRRNFAKKLISLGLVKDTKKIRKIGQHRSPKLYTFDKKNYNKALKEGIVLVI